MLFFLQGFKTLEIYLFYFRRPTRLKYQISTIRRTAVSKTLLRSALLQKLSLPFSVTAEIRNIQHEENFFRHSF